MPSAASTVYRKFYWLVGLIFDPPNFLWTTLLRENCSKYRKRPSLKKSQKSFPVQKYLTSCQLSKSLYPTGKTSAGCRLPGDIININMYLHSGGQK